ncbi:alpha/beta fold hydrolase [Gordonia rhizosphera]|uniref:Putative lipase n=1 Tax=Gordonia rhizosphera NBRC 16068 TaxID=1108045 RepID=K6WVS6_9ACTN|nr:alpha/beta hydrolase [Gordonia rhizosphera]GAB90654.1 putative lipase [Gordonia rhizosphera NBRC 16068]
MSLTTTRFTFTDHAGVELAAQKWEPTGQPVAAVQLMHGMGEHLGRYQHVIDAFTSAGLVVYGYDQRGHGRSIGTGTPGEIGEDGWGDLVDDIGDFARLVRQHEPGRKLVLVGHSMGSFASLQYLLKDSTSHDAIALTGTAALDLLEPALDLDAPLDLAMFNAGFQPPRTDYDWLSRDDSMVDAYIEDPLCGFGLDTGAARSMFVGSRALGDAEVVAGIRPELPFYLAVGDKDPVNGGLALFHPLVERLRAAGVTDVTTRVYPDARHEILNETNRQQVIADLIEWVTDRIGSAAN